MSSRALNFLIVIGLLVLIGSSSLYVVSEREACGCAALR